MTRIFRINAALVGALALLSISGVTAQERARMDKMDKTNAMMNDFTPFTKEAFSAAQADGKTTLLFFHAPWCPVCKAQEPKIAAHLSGDARQVVAFKVDYDTSADLRKALRVAKQSTVILYQGTKEVARLSYKSDDASIDELFSHAGMKPMMSGGR